VSQSEDFKNDQFSDILCPTIVIRQLADPDWIPACARMTDELGPSRWILGSSRGWHEMPRCSPSKSV